MVASTCTRNVLFAKGKMQYPTNTQQKEEMHPTVCPLGGNTSNFRKSRFIGANRFACVLSNLVSTPNRDVIFSLALSQLSYHSNISDLTKQYYLFLN